MPVPPEEESVSREDFLVSKGRGYEEPELPEVPEVLLEAIVVGFLLKSA
jgi:hypothetical protein